MCSSLDYGSFYVLVSKVSVVIYEQERVMNFLRMQLQQDLISCPGVHALRGAGTAGHETTARLRLAHLFIKLYL